MTYVVTIECDSFKYTDCVAVCPVDAFHEGPNMLYINPEICIDCDACVKECPVEAIFVAEDIPEKWIDNIDLNKEMNKIYPVISKKAKPLKSASWID